VLVVPGAVEAAVVEVEGNVGVGVMELDLSLIVVGADDENVGNVDVLLLTPLILLPLLPVKRELLGLELEPAREETAPRDCEPE
jgi:hypothetical protein